MCGQVLRREGVRGRGGSVANVQVLPVSSVANVGLVMGYNLAEDKGPKTKDRGWGTKDKGRAKAILCPLSSVLCPFTTGGDPRAAATRKMRVVPVRRVRRPRPTIRRGR